LVNEHETIQGQSQKGTKAVKKSKVTKGTNITVIAAISPKYGLLYYETHKYSQTAGGVNADRFLIFLVNLLKHHLLNIKPFYFIMDNSRIHPRQEIEDLFNSQHSRKPKHHLF
jgi:hypothetical protein